MPGAIVTAESSHSFQTSRIPSNEECVMEATVEYRSPVSHQAAQAAQPSALPPDPLQAGMLMRVLDEIDHGLLLLDLTGRILHANYPARRELSTARVLRSVQGMLGGGGEASQSKI